MERFTFDLDEPQELSGELEFEPIQLPIYAPRLARSERESFNSLFEEPPRIECMDKQRSNGSKSSRWWHKLTPTRISRSKESGYSSRVTNQRIALASHSATIAEGRKFYSDIGMAKIQSMEAAIALATNGQAIVSGGPSYFDEDGVNVGISKEKRNILGHNTAMIVLREYNDPLQRYAETLNHHLHLLEDCGLQSRINEVNTIHKAVQKAQNWIQWSLEDEDANKTLPGMKFKDPDRIKREIQASTKAIDDVRFDLQLMDSAGLVVTSD